VNNVCTAAWLSDNFEACRPVAGPVRVTYRRRYASEKEKLRLWAMAVKIWLHEGDKPVYPLRKSYC
jgi:hypothetical protein